MIQVYQWSVSKLFQKANFYYRIPFFAMEHTKNLANNDISVLVDIEWTKEN